jgi:hypothetical protein
VSGYGLDTRAIEVRSLAEAKGFFPLTSVSRSALRPTQPPVQWVPVVLSPGLKRGRGVTLTTHPHLVSTSGMSRSYIYSPPSASVACTGPALAFRGISNSRSPAEFITGYPRNKRPLPPLYGPTESSRRRKNVRRKC